MEDGRYVPGSAWFYGPNKGAPAFFATAFLLSGLFHFWQCFHYKSWRLTGLYPFCGLIFTAGFVMREVGAFMYSDIETFIASFVLVYVAPPLYELANYYILGRILYFVPHHSPLHPGRVLSTFGAISVVIEVLNVNGAANVANTNLPQNKQNTGKALLKAALLAQLVVVILFQLLAVVFHRRCLKGGIQSARVNGALMILYISNGLIFVRTVFRVVEFFTITELHVPKDAEPMTMSPLIRYEWFFYVFDGCPMLANTMLFNLRHPRRYLPKSTKVYLAEDGVTEITGQGYKEDRSFLATLLDPFDVSGPRHGRS